VEFRRITNLPPYVFTIIDGLKVAARRAGEDVIDLGFGNPDLPSPPTAVDKLCEAVRNPRNHRYSASRGIPKLRQAVADLYQRRFGVTLDPETEAITTIGAKEGFSHLMWVLLQPGDAALVPSPSYPIHIWGPLFAGADVREIPVGTGEDFFENVQQAYRFSWPRPRVIVLSFPHNPTWPSCSGWSTSPSRTRSCWSTTTPTPSSASTASARPRSSRPTGPRSARSSCTR
jgi:alanine-synthesizing transaminase